MQRMKTTTRGRGPNGQFVSLDTPDRPLISKYTLTDYASLLFAAAVAVGAALLLARCHMVWLEENRAAVVTLPQDLPSPLD